jgi:hypothetical protein
MSVDDISAHVTKASLHGRKRKRRRERERETDSLTLQAGGRTAIGVDGAICRFCGFWA